MKKQSNLCLVLILLVSVTACAKAPTWQEQYDLGIRYLSEGNYEEAIITFTAAIEIDPKQVPAYVGRGDAYVGRGDAYIQASDTTENQAGAKADYEAAQTDYEAAIELDETIIDAYLGLAEVYIRQGDTEAAIDILERGYQITGDETLNQRRQELGVSGDDEVVWADDTLETFVREWLDRPSGTIHVRDLDEITYLVVLGDTAVLINEEAETKDWHYRYVQSVVADGHGELYAYYEFDGTEYTERGRIANVDSLRYFRNLVAVEIIANHVTDISVFDSLSKLEYANVWGNDIADLSPLDRLPDEYITDNTEQYVEIGDML